MDKVERPVRVNARNTDIFDLFNFQEYLGPNPYLNRASLVFELALTGYDRPLPISDYLAVLGERYPRLTEKEYASHAELFASTASVVNKLDMDLHLQGWSVQQHGHLPLPQVAQPYPQESESAKIAIEALHLRTTRQVIYTVWDWFEAIQRGLARQSVGRVSRLEGTVEGGGFPAAQRTDREGLWA